MKDHEHDAPHITTWILIWTRNHLQKPSELLLFVQHLHDQKETATHERQYATSLILA
jgi:hypothetical protein